MSDGRCIALLNEGLYFDYYICLQFIKKLSTPFDETDAFKLGIINKDGDFLKSRSQLTTQKEKDACTIFDVICWNLKKLINLVPYGKSKLASYAAALWLMKESARLQQTKLDSFMLAEEFKDWWDVVRTDERTMQRLRKLMESEHMEGFEQWGWIDCNGKLIRGEEHPTADTHGDLLADVAQIGHGVALESGWIRWGLAYEELYFNFYGYLLGPSALNVALKLLKELAPRRVVIDSRTRTHMFTKVYEGPTLSQAARCLQQLADDAINESSQWAYTDWGIITPDGQITKGKRDSTHNSLSLFMGYENSEALIKAGGIRYALVSEDKTAMFELDAQVTRDALQVALDVLAGWAEGGVEHVLVDHGPKVDQFTSLNDAAKAFSRWIRHGISTQIGEAKHQEGFEQWGWIDPAGHIINGHDHQKAKSHEDLASEVVRSIGQDFVDDIGIFGLQAIGCVRWIYTSEELHLNFSRRNVSGAARQASVRLLKELTPVYTVLDDNYNSKGYADWRAAARAMGGGAIVEGAHEGALEHWGFISPGGGVIDGNTISGVHNHGALADKLVGEKSGMLKLMPQGYIRWGVTYEDYDGLAQGTEAIIYLEIAHPAAVTTAVKLLTKHRPTTISIERPYADKLCHSVAEAAQELRAMLNEDSVHGYITWGFINNTDERYYEGNDADENEGYGIQHLGLARKMGYKSIMDAIEQGCTRCAIDRNGQAFLHFDWPKMTSVGMWGVHDWLQDWKQDIQQLVVESSIGSCPMQHVYSDVRAAIRDARKGVRLKVKAESDEQDRKADIDEDVPANNAGDSKVAGLVGEPPIRKRKPRLLRRKAIPSQ